MTEPAVIAAISGLLLYVLILILGRWLKRKCGVGFGVLYQLFAITLATFVPLALISAHPDLLRGLGGALIILSTLVVLALVRRFFWEYYFEQRHRTHVPKFMRQLVTMVVVLLAIIFVLSVIYRLRIPGLLAGSGIIAVIVGLAMQDLLGNIIAGFSLNIGQPFKAGDWLVLDKYQAEVIETNWRSTRLRTNDNVLLDIPNNQIAKQMLINLGNPVGQHSMRMHVHVDNLVPPNQVKAALFRATSQAEGVLEEPPPRVFLANFNESSILYEIKFALRDHQRFNEISDAIKTNIWYELQRDGIRIPFPVHTVQLERPHKPGKSEQIAALAPILGRQQLFRSLTPEQLRELATHARTYRFGRGERIIEQGCDGDSMFILLRGEASVIIEREGGATRVAALRENACFGEMSLLTGEKRNATVSAATDCEVVSIEKECLAGVLKECPELMQRLSELLAARRLESEVAFANVPRPAEQERQRQYAAGFLRRLRSFFEL